MTTVKASSIPQGQCFRKQSGSYVYLRISEAAVKFHGLDQSLVYGVSFNGNICDVTMDTKVVAMPPSAMTANRDEDREWHKRVGAKYP